MKSPHELMSNTYCGPSKVISLGQIRNQDGFRLVGIDKNGGEHSCVVRKGDGGSYYLESNTTTFQDLIGWLPDGKLSDTGNSGITQEQTLDA